MRIAVLLVITILLYVAVWMFVPVLHRDVIDYGRFAGGIAPNVWSNLGFLIVGILGLRKVRDLQWRVFFLGIVLTAFGSAWFHLDPYDGVTTNWPRLFWDRLPMTIAFGAFLSIMVSERISRRAGLILLPVLIAIGVGTVFYWYASAPEHLYPYAFFQLYTAVGPLLIVALFRGERSRYLLIAVVLFALAKLFEVLDVFFYEHLRISGHVLKHLTAAAATYALVRHASGATSSAAVTVRLASDVT